MEVILDTTFVQVVEGVMLFGDDVCMPIDAAAVIETIEIFEDVPAQTDPWRCSECGSDMRVLDKRNYDGCISRRRQCVNCPTRFTTHETVRRISRNTAKPPKWTARAREQLP